MIDVMRLEAGCIGYASMALISAADFVKRWEQLAKGAKNEAALLQAFRDALVPQNYPGIQGPWLKVEDALAWKGVTSPPGPNFVLFAVLGRWKAGKPPRADANGQVPKDSIIVSTNDKDENFGQFDYAVYHPSQRVWVDANATVAVGRQRWSVKKKAPEPGKTWGIVYFIYNPRGGKK